MLLNSVSISTDKSFEYLWAKIQDVKNWKLINDKIDKATILGDFEKGVKGIVSTLKGNTYIFEITELKKPSYLVLSSKVFTITIVNEYRIQEQEGLRIVSYSTNIYGFLAPLYNLVQGKRIKKDMIDTLFRLTS